MTPLVDGLRRPERDYGVETETLVPNRYDERGLDLTRATARLAAALRSAAEP